MVRRNVVRTRKPRPQVDEKIKHLQGLLRSTIQTIDKMNGIVREIENVLPEDASPRQTCTLVQNNLVSAATELQFALNELSLSEVAILIAALPRRPATNLIEH